MKLKFKLRAVWRILTCKGFYLASHTGQVKSIWNTSYGLDTQQARIIIKSLQQVVRDTDDSTQFLSDVKDIISQKNDKP